MKKKVKRVVIVDDNEDLVAKLSKAAKSTGHEVLDIFVKHDDDLSALAEKIKNFHPNIVFLDHDLNRFETGQALAKLIGFPSKMLVGTSTAFRQDYCGKTFDGKDYEHENGLEAKNFLKMIKQS